MTPRSAARADSGRTSGVARILEAIRAPIRRFRLRRFPVPLAIIVVIAVAASADWYIWRAVSAIRTGLPLEVVALDRQVASYLQDVRRLERALELAALRPSPRRIRHLRDTVDIAVVRLGDMTSISDQNALIRFRAINARLTVLIEDLDIYLAKGRPAERALERFQRRTSAVVGTIQPIYDETSYRTIASLSKQRFALDRFRVSLEALLILVAAAAIALVLLLLKTRRAMAGLEASQRERDRHIDQIENAKSRLEAQSTELIEAAEAIEAARDAAEAANRAKSEFLANMSHELRTPLNAIIGFSEVIKSDVLGPSNEQRYREYASDINESGHHLLDLITDILDLSKIESGADDLSEEVIEIRDLTQSVITLVKARAQTGGVALSTDIDEAPAALFVDRRKLKQILVNLLSNAIKFTDSGGSVALRINREAAGNCIVRVEDTGIGIAPEDIPKALSPFGQVDGDINRRYEGTGLGLPLTKSLVEQHGGTMELVSAPGVGTTVILRFPVERNVEREAAPSG